MAVDQPWKVGDIVRLKPEWVRFIQEKGSQSYPIANTGEVVVTSVGMYGDTRMQTIVVEGTLCWGHHFETGEGPW